MSNVDSCSQNRAPDKLRNICMDTELYGSLKGKIWPIVRMCLLPTFTTASFKNLLTFFDVPCKE